MLFHVTMTHTVDDCPGYNPEKMPEVLASFEKVDAVAKELTIKVHFYVEAAPEHVAYALLETDNQSSILGFLTASPMRQDFKITPVMQVQDIVAFSREMMRKMGQK